MFSVDSVVDRRPLCQRIWGKMDNRNMNSFTVNQLEKARLNPVNIRKPFNIMLIFHGYFVQMYHRPLQRIHAEPIVCVINPVWRGSAWPGQWINLTVHKSDLLLYVCLVFKRSPRSIKTANCCQNIKASPFALSTASTQKNLRNLGAQTVRQHPKGQGKEQTHAAVKTLTNMWIMNHQNWWQMLLLRSRQGIQ